LSRGFSTTVPETSADAGTAPAALAPVGMRGAASTGLSLAARAGPAAAGDAGSAHVADMISIASKDAVRAAVQRRPP
jgi:hypothetical protein